MRFELASDIQGRVNHIINVLNYDHLDSNRIICIRSYNSKSNALARIWGLSRVWQKVLNVKSHYIIEVLNPRFDKLSKEEQEKTLIHELLHIPKKFSGGLVPHKCFGKRIDRRKVEEIYKKYFDNSKDRLKFWLFR
jgi:predicted metallopeptidase